MFSAILSRVDIKVMLNILVQFTLLQYMYEMCRYPVADIEFSQLGFHRRHRIPQGFIHDWQKRSLTIRVEILNEKLDHSLTLKKSLHNYEHYPFYTIFMCIKIYQCNNILQGLA